MLGKSRFLPFVNVITSASAADLWRGVNNVHLKVLNIDRSCSFMQQALSDIKRHFVEIRLTQTGASNAAGRALLSADAMSSSTGLIMGNYTDVNLDTNQARCQHQHLSFTMFH